MTVAPNPTNGLCLCCGTALPAEAPGERCPKCLLGFGLDDALDDSVRTHCLNGQRFGDYELLEEIARGGMGLVFKARQGSLNRIVALKLILSGQFASKNEVLRFRAEAEAAANLRHPNIVAIYETGEHDGQHYFSMEYVAGRDLGTIVRDGPLAPLRAARYAETVARAIHYAHEEGTLHRDLKPSNVLIDAQDEPRVTDFGIAKRLRGDFGITVTGQILGSPGFMPPEQTSGQNSRVGRASDVYGIGAILYHLLTGRPPFQAATIPEVLKQLNEQEPIAPSLLNPGVPLDLETICVKCLEKDPTKRFATAQELADELGRFQRHEPIRCRPIGRLGRLRRWCRRKPLVAGLTAAVAIAVTSGLSGIGWQAHERSHALMETRRLLYASDMSAAQQAWNSANPEILRELLAQHRPKPGAEDLRGFEWRLLSRWHRNDERSVLVPHGSVDSLSYSADGKRLATFNSSSGRARVWRLEEGSPGSSEADFSGVTALSFSPKGNVLALSTTNAGLSLWDAGRSSGLGRIVGTPASARFMAFCADGSEIAIAETNDAVSVWRMPAGELQYRVEHLRANRSLAFSPDAKFVAAGEDHIVRLWDLVAKKMVLQIPSGDNVVLRKCEFSPDGRVLAVMSGDEVRCYSVTRRELEFTMIGVNRSEVAAFAPNGEALVSGGWAGVYLWDLKTREFSAASRAHKNLVTSLAFAPDGRHVAMGTPGGVWIENLHPNDPFEKATYAQAIKGISFSPDNLLLAVGTQTGLVLRNISTGDESRLLEEQPHPTYAVAFSPDNNLLATGSDDDLVRLWDVQTRTNLATIAGHSGWVRSAVFSPDGRLLATCQSSETGPTVRVWRVRRGLEAAATLSQAGGARTLCFSPDGKYLAVGTLAGEVSLWSVDSWQRRAQHHEHAIRSPNGSLIQSAIFLDAGRTLATADASGWIVLWDMEQRRVSRSWQAHPSGIRSLALSADGRTLASGGYDEELILWHVSTWRPMLRLKHPASIFTTAFSKDGTMLATGGDDMMIRLWSAPPLNELRR